MRLSFQQQTQLSDQLLSDLSKIEHSLKRDRLSALIESQQLFTATFNERHVGYAVAAVNQQQLTVEQFAVRDATRRRGVGLFMFQQLLQWSAAQGLEGVVFPEVSDEAAKGFYQHLGLAAHQLFRV
ncbi:MULTISPECIES: acetyl-CoA sensor PanZ family protein [Aliagarivorans]|uniref:acetyl-CoA sensor PanZ family protein n=1 Tax=Aliagarivorans TaxID=882379 RepID=UPI000429E6F3|nr:MULTISPECIES: acetyl-CoA sensor PanZ family protein [Aliagarivorans]